MKIKTKILLPMIAVVLVSVAAILSAVSVIFSNYVDNTMEIATKRFSDAAIGEFNGLKQQAERSSSLIASNAEFVAAVAAADHAAVLELAKFFDQNLSIEFITVADADGNVVARSHEPDSYGDSVLGQENVKQALAGNVYTTIEQGTAVKLSVRSGVPLYNEGEIVGVVSTGYRLDTVDFVDRIHMLTGAEATIFLGDERLSTTVQNADGTRAVGTKAAENVSAQVLSGSNYTGTAQILGRDAYVEYVPIKATNGGILGMLFVGQFADAKNEAMRSFILVAGAISLLLLVGSAAVISVLANRITKPIKAMVEASGRLADGETDVQLVVNTKDEMRDLADEFENMIEGARRQAEVIETISAGDLTSNVELRSDRDVVGKALLEMLKANNEIFAMINATANEVSVGANQISDGAQSLAQGSTEQAAVVQELSAAISTLAATAKANAEITEQSVALGERIRGNTESGSQQMEILTRAVADIADASQSIAGVIKVIDDIAFQTNILALNASVEAARAGAHGKGFAVVAEEVRNLAGKSAEAAKETGRLITNSIEKAELGSQIARQTAESFSEIMSGISENSKLVGVIAVSSNDSSEAIEQINVGIDQVAQVIQMNTASSEESASASEELSSQSQALKQLIGHFRIKEADQRSVLTSDSTMQAQLLERSQYTAFESSKNIENLENLGKY